MDTRLCEAVYALADGVDLLVIEATYMDADADLAAAHAHLTAAQAARVAAECGVRRLVLTHFSQRYTDNAAFVAEARQCSTVISSSPRTWPGPGAATPLTPSSRCGPCG
jgi:ribonuclease Z